MGSDEDTSEGLYELDMTTSEIGDPAVSKKQSLPVSRHEFKRLTSNDFSTYEEAKGFFKQNRMKYL